MTKGVRSIVTVGVLSLFLVAFVCGTALAQEKIGVLDPQRFYSSILNLLKFKKK